MKKYNFLCLLLFFVSGLYAQDTLKLTVINTVSGTQPGSLQWALDSAEQTDSKVKLISFNIPGTGPFVISPQLPLTISANRVTLDATTQPGYEPGMVKIDMSEPFTEFTIQADSCEVYGIHFVNSGIISGGVGLTLAGSFNRIGAPGKGNIFTENDISGIQIGDLISVAADSNIIQGNYIGAEPLNDGTFLPRANESYGIFIKNVGYNLIGGTKPGEGNIIAYNPVGIEFESSAPVTISGNDFACNALVGIQFGSPANALPAPVITSATVSSLSGKATPGTVVEVFLTSQIPDIFGCFQSVCQGGTSLGRVVVQPDSSWTLSGGFYSPGFLVTAIATASTGGSSVFADCMFITCSVNDLVVTSLEENGPGSFRAVMECAETLFTPATVSFNLPGPAPWVINLVSGQFLEFTISDLVLDGTTQPGYQPGSVILDGAGVTETFSIFGNSVEVYGMHFRNFSISGLSMGGYNNRVGAPGKGNVFVRNLVGLQLVEGNTRTIVQSNYIGTLPDVGGDFPDEGNAGSGIEIFESDSLLIGGKNPLEQNIIAYNDTAIRIDQNSASINVSANRMFCNSNGGIVFENQLTNNGKERPVILIADVNEISGTSEPGDTVALYVHDAQDCNASQAVCQGKFYVAETIASPNGTWQIAGNVALGGLSITALATEARGNTSEFSECVDIEAVEDIIEVIDTPDAFTPNGDGTNEQFIIENIENFPDNELIILNRWGNQVYYSRSYKNDWTGTTSGGQPLLEGTYFYVLRIFVNGVKNTKRGAITIVR
ncbi:MAG: gliding motility-associated C-terminal domain-containing protein [Bacteroidia bacterium]|nr:gliding motility-associated C-terminal domain-containing protein [Bacteroidia bacterium]